METPEPDLIYATGCKHPSLRLQRNVLQYRIVFSIQKSLNSLKINMSGVHLKCKMEVLLNIY
jgi:hypothetical protein